MGYLTLVNCNIDDYNAYILKLVQRVIQAFLVFFWSNGSQCISIY